MTRKARDLSETGIYHVILRGNERKAILADQDEKQYFLDCLMTKQDQINFSVYGYCLMDNHIHLLINVEKNEIAAIMRGIATRYAFFYNNRHNRVGHVFQDRFKSEPIDDERHLMAAIRYIHNNPVKAGMVGEAGQYAWSSYNIYMRTNPTAADWLDTAFVLDMIASDPERAVNEFQKFSECTSEEPFIDIEDKQVIRTVDKGEEILRQYLRQNGIMTEIEDVREDRQLRTQAIAFLRAHTHLSQRKIAELLRVDKSVVEKVGAPG